MLATLSFFLFLYPPVPIRSRLLFLFFFALIHVYMLSVSTRLSSLAYRLPFLAGDVEEQLVQLVLPWPGSSRDLSALCTLDVSLGRSIDSASSGIDRRYLALVGSADAILGGTRLLWLSRWELSFQFESHLLFSILFFQHYTLDW